MSFLLDTNVVSEWVKPVPDRGVVEWTDTIDEDRVFLSVITLAEIRHGVERLSHSRRRSQLEAWLDGELPLRFEGRVLDINPAVAHAWGRLMAQAFERGRPVGIMDGFIAASAHVHGLTVVTRDIEPYELADVPVQNPWRSAS
jgi:predicted nucleic acid-binding protein